MQIPLIAVLFLSASFILTPLRIASARSEGSGRSVGCGIVRYAPRFTEARILARKKPVITDEMRAMHPEHVTIDFFIAPEGHSEYKLVRYSGDPEVNRAVMKACSSFRFRAATDHGRPVKSRLRITFDPNG